MNSACSDWYKPAGFPHSEISESRVVCTSSELIAAYHVLHRLHAPRHPPCALSSLTIKFAHRKTLDQHTPDSLTPSSSPASRIVFGRPNMLRRFYWEFAYSIIKEHSILRSPFLSSGEPFEYTLKDHPCQDRLLEPISRHEPGGGEGT